MLKSCNFCGIMADIDKSDYFQLLPTDALLLPISYVSSQPVVTWKHVSRQPKLEAPFVGGPIVSTNLCVTAVWKNKKFVNVFSPGDFRCMSQN